MWRARWQKLENIHLLTFVKVLTRMRDAGREGFAVINGGGISSSVSKVKSLMRVSQMLYIHTIIQYETYTFLDNSCCWSERLLVMKRTFFLVFFFFFNFRSCFYLCFKIGKWAHRDKNRKRQRIKVSLYFVFVNNNGKLESSNRKLLFPSLKKECRVGNFWNFYGRERPQF